MFESLTNRLTGVFSDLARRGRLTEKDIDEALREVRLALLEADVDFNVARGLVRRIKEQSQGQNVYGSLSPGQTVLKIVQQELAQILGSDAAVLERSPQPPTVLMMVGLQGSGKTTTVAKLALHLKKSGQSVMMAACDLHRPAAIDQLQQLGDELSIPVHCEDPSKSSAAEVATRARSRAKSEDMRWLLLDTAGRLHVDDDLMRELEDIGRAASPTETILVVDAMTGQDAVRSGTAFQERIGLTGIIITKLDGDARGGAALSMRSVTGLPIKFVGVGEKTNALEIFHPSRMASRILGLGDVETLIERASEEISFERGRSLEEKLRRAEFDMNDLIDQLKTLRRMGSLSDVLGMIPGMSALRGKLDLSDVDERRMARVEAIVFSMTPEERSNPKLINGSRRKRIAIGSGTSPAEVNQILNQFRQMQSVMKKMTSADGQRGLMDIVRGRL